MPATNELRSRAHRLRPLLVAVALAFSVSIGVPATPVAAAQYPPLQLPFGEGQTWCVYQGYGDGSHSNSYSLDLTYGTSCSSTSSTGADVLAPGAGTARAYGDGMCITLQRGGAVLLGHVAPSVSLPRSVSVNEKVGDVRAPYTGNNHVAHIHFEHWAGDCTPNVKGVDFDDHYSLQCVGDLPGATDPSQGPSYWHELLTRPSNARFGTDFLDICKNTHGNRIAWLVNEGITAGCGTQQYCPKGVVNRASMATFLARYMSLPAVPATYNPFDDDDGNPHEARIEQIAYAGITSGCGTRIYCPDDVVTRGSMATFLARALDLPAVPANYNPFDDDDGNPHEARIEQIAYAGITSGCGTRAYCPNGTVLRDQLATFLYNGRNYR